MEFIKDNFFFVTIKNTSSWLCINLAAIKTDDDNYSTTIV